MTSRYRPAPREATHTPEGDAARVLREGASE
jgi:hypothetical protein